MLKWGRGPNTTLSRAVEGTGGPAPGACMPLPRAAWPLCSCWRRSRCVSDATALFHRWTPPWHSGSTGGGMCGLGGCPSPRGPKGSCLSPQVFDLLAPGAGLAASGWHVCTGVFVCGVCAEVCVCTYVRLGPLACTASECSGPLSSIPARLGPGLGHFVMKEAFWDGREGQILGNCLRQAAYPPGMGGLCARECAHRPGPGQTLCGVGVKTLGETRQTAGGEGVLGDHNPGRPLGTVPRRCGSLKAAGPATPGCSPGTPSLIPPSLPGSWWDRLWSARSWPEMTSSLWAECAPTAWARPRALTRVASSGFAVLGARVSLAGSISWGSPLCGPVRGPKWLLLAGA